jgi:GLPGLI family protein
MKRFALFFSLILLSGIAVVGQSTQGKIVYQISIDDPPQQYKRVIMWFTADTYIYRYEQNPPKPGTPVKSKKFISIQDSIRNARIEAQFNEAQDEANASQLWYGELGNDVVTNRTFDQDQKFYCIRDTLNFVSWQLTGDTMTTHNILCQKAIGKYHDMDFIAWFAPSIPVSVAPLQLRGLPGLLIEETNKTTGRTVSMTELEWPAKETVAIQPPGGAPFISRKEYDKLFEDQKKAALRMIDELKKQGKIQEIKTND